MSTSVEKNTKMPPSLLVSATYDSQKKAAVLKFNDPKTQKNNLP